MTMAQSDPKTRILELDADELDAIERALALHRARAFEDPLPAGHYSAARQVWQALKYLGAAELHVGEPKPTSSSARSKHT